MPNESDSEPPLSQQEIERRRDEVVKRKAGEPK